MTIVRDASSPARVLNGLTGGNVQTYLTAAFSPPASTWLYFHITGNPSGTGGTPTFNTPTNTGTALTWTLVGSVNNASGGASGVWRAFNTSLQSGITVSASITWTGTASSSASSAAWLDVWTGGKTSQTGAAVQTSTSATQTNNPSVTTTASGSQVAMAGLDWAATGAPTSSDTIDAYTVALQTSGGRAFKAANSGAAGSVSVNFVDGGAGPINAFVIYEILAAVVAAGPDPSGPDGWNWNWGDEAITDEVMLEIEVRSSAPVGANAPPPPVNEDPLLFQAGDDYEDPILQLIDFTPVQANAPPDGPIEDAWPWSYDDEVSDAAMVLLLDDADDALSDDEPALQQDSFELFTDGLDEAEEFRIDDGPVVVDAQTPALDVVQDAPDFDVDTADDWWPLDDVLGADSFPRRQRDTLDLDEVDEDVAWWIEGSGPVPSEDAAAQDAPDFDVDIGEDWWPLDEQLGASAAAPVDIVLQDAPDFDTEVEDWWPLDDVLGADQVAIVVDAPVQDAPDFDVDIGEDWWPLDEVLGADLVVAAVDGPVQDAPDFDLEAGDDWWPLDEVLGAPALAAPVPLEDWWHDEVEDEWQTGLDAVLGAGAAQLPALAYSEAWDFNGEDTDDNDYWQESTYASVDSLAPPYRLGNGLVWHVGRRRRAVRLLQRLRASHERRGRAVRLPARGRAWNVGAIANAPGSRKRVWIVRENTVTTLEKRTSESLLYDIDFSLDLVAGEIITSVTSIAADGPALTVPLVFGAGAISAVPIVYDDHTAPTATVVQVRISAGSIKSGALVQDCIVRCKVATNLNPVVEGTVRLQLNDTPPKP